MRRRQTKDDEEYLLTTHRPIPSGEESVQQKQVKTNKIPGRAIKSIIIAILLVILGIACYLCLILSYTDILYYAFHDHRLMLFVIGTVTIPCGGYTLILAYRCYYMIGQYRWPMIFL